MIQKSCKTKKSYKKIEAEAHSINDPVNDEKPMTKKEKEKVSTRIVRKCQRVTAK